LQTISVARGDRPELDPEIARDLFRTAIERKFSSRTRKREERPVEAPVPSTSVVFGSRAANRGVEGPNA
jgi:hypothetical protein